MQENSHDRPPRENGNGPSRANRPNGDENREVSLDLTRQEVHQGQRAGDRYVRVVRIHGELFEHVGPGYLRATEGASSPKTTPQRVFSAVKRVLIGAPLPNRVEITERLTKLKALPIFASDAISSVAYATEEVLLVLALAGTGALALSIPISLTIALLLSFVAFSYRQTVYAYPTGGGSYVVSKENIGTTAGLIAAAALTLDYILTVSVSIASGTAALTSAFGVLLPYRVPLELLFLLIMIVGNLRGIRESANLFAAPTYVFIFGLSALILVGGARWILGLPPTEEVQASAIEGSEAISLWLILTAFSAGSVAMSGTEAISNGVAAFKPPEGKNAAATLTMMAAILAFFFLGIGLLAHAFRVSPSEAETVLSQLARAVFGKSFFYYLIQFATMAILILAANTSFNGFPRLASILAQDGFLPRYFANRGDRLAFSYGIVVLGGVAGLLIVVFAGNTHALIPLYAVGVFLAFTMSQLGMIRHWLRLRTAGWKRSIVINALGASMCAVVLGIAVVTKFERGAWIIVVLLPVLVGLFQFVHHHYATVARQLQIEVNGGGHEFGELRQIVLVPMADLNLASARALEFAHGMSERVNVVHVVAREEDAAEFRYKLSRFDPAARLIIVESPFRTLVEPLLAYVDALHDQDEQAFVTVVVPEFLTEHWWERLLHNGTAERLNRALRPQPNVVVVNVPYRLELNRGAPEPLLSRLRTRVRRMLPLPASR